MKTIGISTLILNVLLFLAGCTTGTVIVPLDNPKPAALTAASEVQFPDTSVRYISFPAVFPKAWAVKAPNQPAE